MLYPITYVCKFFQASVSKKNLMIEELIKEINQDNKLGWLFHDFERVFFSKMSDMKVIINIKLKNKKNIRLYFSFSKGSL